MKLVGNPTVIDRIEVLGFKFQEGAKNNNIDSLIIWKCYIEKK